MEYKSVHKIEGWGNPYVKELGIDIRISVGRELTKDEEREFYRIGENIQKMLIKNTMLMNEDYQKQLQEEKENLLSLFGDKKIWVVEIANGYAEFYLNPWFKVYTEKGPITIGWRKRVINIDWSESDITIEPASLLKEDEMWITHGTGDGQYIHAWGYDKAKEYITKLLNS